MAEGRGFEPRKGVSPFNDLANRRLQPLGHPPAGVIGSADKILTNSHVQNTRRMLLLSLTSISPTVKYQNHLFAGFDIAKTGQNAPP